MSCSLEYLIEDDFFKSIKEEVICTICLDIKIEPIMCTKCQNSYCSKCIKNWEKKSSECPFKCPSPSYITARVVKNLICKLNFRCKNGCDEIIPFEKFQAHNEFECKKLNYKEKYENLLQKYNILLEEKKKLQENFDFLFKFKIDSMILENSNEIFFIHKILSNNYKPGFRLQLLYRATRDGDTGPNFHQCVDNKQGGILVIIQTDKNIKFGGFSDAVWISYVNPEKKTIGKNFCGNINFLFQINSQKTFALKNYMKKLTSIFCRSDVGPCFGELGEDIWIRSGNFLQKGGMLHKDKEKGRICSFDTKDYELNNGEPNFNIKELEAFWLQY